MVENKNEFNFEDNKPWTAPHSSLSLEGHWQPWYDDRRDYGTNAPTYYDYLANFNGLIKSIVDFVNELAKRDVDTENTSTIELIKTTSWIVNDLNKSVLKANVKLSKASGNKLVIKNDGLFVPTDDLTELKNQIKTLQSNFNTLSAKVDKFQSSINTNKSNIEVNKTEIGKLKTRLDLLDGGGWATKEQLEELKSIINANKTDYENADSGLRLIISNMQKRLDALDGLSSEMDTWNEKVKKLEADALNVKNIATLAGTLAGALSVNSYKAVEVTTLPVIDKKNGFKTQYNSYTQRIDGRITRIERLGFDFEGITTNGGTGEAGDGVGMKPIGWTKIAKVATSKMEGDYGAQLSRNIRYQAYAYSFRFYQNFFQDYTDQLLHPWEMRIMYDKVTGEFALFSRGLKQLATAGEIFHSTQEDLYTIVTWLDDKGNEYLPSYDSNGKPKPLAQCDPVPEMSTWSSEGATIEDALPVVEHEGKYYFKDEADVGNYNHPICI